MSTLVLALAAWMAVGNGQEGAPAVPGQAAGIVRAAKLARGWATARLLYKGMPARLWEPLTRGMRLASVCGTLRTRIYSYSCYGLVVVADGDGNVLSTDFIK